MSTIKNRIQLIGHVGNSPEVQSFENGKRLARISLATNDFYYNAEGTKVQQTDWHNLIGWGKQANIIERYVTKGKEIAVEGKLISRSYESKSGEKKFITEVVVHEILLLGEKDSQ